MTWQRRPMAWHRHLIDVFSGYLPDPATQLAMTTGNGMGLMSPGPQGRDTPLPTRVDSVLVYRPEC